MYDPRDPRAALAGAGSGTPAATTFAAAEYALFHQQTPIAEMPGVRSWFTRAQNFLIVYSEAEGDATFTRDDQVDEYAVLFYDHSGTVEVTADGEAATAPARSLIFIPPGRSTVRLPAGGALVRIFTTRAADLVARCSNTASYAVAHPNVTLLTPWPVPADGYRIRCYDIDVPLAEGRFGRIWRCTTLMVNFLDVKQGPRDVTRMSPHAHDDFEQCSFAATGSFIHHIRWPWTTNMNNWREDDHALCPAPSVAIIPPPSLHTTQAIGPDANQLVDIFSPPRMDFSSKDGWVLNAADYPMP